MRFNTVLASFILVSSITCCGCGEKNGNMFEPFATRKQTCVIKENGVKRELGEEEYYVFYDNDGVERKIVTDDISRFTLPWREEIWICDWPEYQHNDLPKCLVRCEDPNEIRPTIVHSLTEGQRHWLYSDMKCEMILAADSIYFDRSVECVVGYSPLP